MRFLMRSLLGFALFAVAVAAVIYGGVRMAESMAASEGGGRARSGPGERVFAVDTSVVSLRKISPKITAYGEIRGWRTLELRAPSGGYLVELSKKFRDGAHVARGDLLFRIDPEDYAARVADSRAALEEAKADLAEARQTVEVARQELRAAETQRDLRGTGLSRRRGLMDRGVATTAEVEEAEMAVAGAEQAVAARAQAMVAAEIRIERSILRVQRAEITLADTERVLADTTQTAPFDGLLTDVSAMLGGLATPNERLGVLIDPTALEASFRVTNAQFARLLDESGALAETPVTVTLALDDIPLKAPGVIVRSGARIGDGETGRLLFARLDLSSASLLRPGDFVTVAIEERPLENVAQVPASAINEAGELLIVDAEDRLRSIFVRVLRRQRDSVIVAGAPDGARYVVARAPQLSAGVKVRPLGKETPEPEPEAATADADALVDLTPERQARLIGIVEASDQMPGDVKDRLLTALRSGRAPARMLERLETTTGRAG